MNNLFYLDNFHDLTLPEWGPYSKKYFGISHIADQENGMRFDFTVVPSIYRRRLAVPDALRPSGYLPWDVSSDLEDYSYRQQIESKDRVYADVRFARLNKQTRLVECRCINNSDLAVAFGVHLLSSLEAPPEKRVVPVLPEGVIWLDALDHIGLFRAQMRPQDNLIYDGLRRGELRLSGTVRGGCIELGGEPGDRLLFKLPSLMVGATSVALRCRVPAQKTTKLLVNGVAVTLIGSGEWELITIKLPSILSNELELVSIDNVVWQLDGIAVGPRAAESTFVPAKMSITPEISLGPIPNSRILSYQSVAPVYGIFWDFDSNFVRHYRAKSMNDVLLYSDEVHQPFFGGSALREGQEEWVDAVMQPLVAGPKQSVTIYTVVCSGSRVEVETTLRDAAREKLRFGEIAEESRKRCFRAESTEAGAPYQFSRKRLAAVTLTNVVFPTWFKGKNVRHHTPGRRWNCLYTWDSGFIGIGLLELEVRLAVENLNAYLTAPEDEECAFIHHGSPVPVQFYLFAELMNRTGDRELARYFYPKLRHYYRFIAGHSPSSTMRGHGRNTLIRSWDYFYNSGGWDDYPPQIYIHAHKLYDVAPSVGSSHVIRAAKILRSTAVELGIEDDLSMYNDDIAMLEGLLQKYSWDEDADVFSYVRHDAQDHPCEILRHESGLNFNLGLDGVSPLLAGICTPEQKKMLWRRLESPDHCWTPYGISTVDRSAPYYRPDGYWNGSIWMPHQWFFWKAALDDGRADFAWKIAQTALSVYEREVVESRGCYEHFTIAAGRGGGWHHFSALSCPILAWFGAYFVPGRLTSGLETAIRNFSASKNEWHASLEIGGTRGEGDATFLAVTSVGKWSISYNNREYPIRERLSGTIEFDLPRGSSGKLALIRTR